MVCLIESKPKVREQIQSLADKLGTEYDIAKIILQENNGYDLDKAPNGAESKLYKDLLDAFNGDERQALIAKAKTYLQPFFNWFGNWINPLKPGDIVFGHPAIGKTYSLEFGKYKDKIIDWDVEFNEKRDKWIEDHSNTTKGTLEYKKARNEYLIYPEKHPDYLKFVTEEWERVKSKAKKEGKILFASPHNLLKMFPQDFNRIINLKDKDFIKRNIKRGGKEKESKLWKEGINNTILNVTNIPIEYLNEDEYFEDYLDKYIGVSKVVDENGEPLMVYHYTDNENLTEFSTDFDNYFSKTGGTKKAIFFTEDNVEVGSEDNFLTSRKKKLPIFLNVKDLEEHIGTKEDLHKQGTSYREVVNKSAERDGNVSGLVFRGFDDNKKENQTIYVVHSSNQIKSATGNSGEYSGENPNIYHQKEKTADSPRRPNFTAQEHQLSDRMSNILSALFPEISKKYVDSIAGGYVGQIDLDALEILIDRIASGIDTEPHEYAHYYVRMFIDSDLIQEGIRLFGSEEELVQAIGVRTVEMEAKARNWWQKFVDYIKNLLNNNKLYKQQLLAEITDAFLERKQLSIQQKVSGKMYQKAQPTIEEVRNVIFSNQALISFDPLTHSYAVKETGEKLTSVTDMKKNALYDTYDNAQEDEIQAEISEESRNVGTSIHAVLEAMIKNNFNRNDFSQFTDEAIKDIKQIYNYITEKYDIVLSEAILCSVEHKIAGTIDLLVRNKKTGKYEIIDYKTKMYSYNGKSKNKKGKNLWGFKFIDSKKYSLKTARDSYDFQLTAYENMLKKLGIEIDKRNILPIVYNMNNDKIQKVMISKVFGNTSVEENNKQTAREIERRSQTQYDVSYRIFGDQTALKVSKDQLDNAVNDITETVNKIVKRLHIQKELFSLRGKRARNQLYEATRALEQIEGLTELDALLHFVNYAASQLKRLNDQIEKRYKQGSEAEWNLDILIAYREVAISYNNIDRITGIAHRYSELFGEENVRAIDAACSRLQSYKSNILSACDAIGKQLHLEAIAPYINNERNRILQEFRSKYIKDNPKKESENEEDFQSRVQDNVNQYEKEHEEEIQYKTKEWIRHQTEIAESGFECSSVFANFASVYQSKDPIVQATVILFDRVMNEKERKVTNFRYKLNKAVKAYREKYGIGNFSTLRDVFDDFVEIVGETPYLVNEMGAAYMEAEAQARKSIFEDNTLTIKEKQEKFRQWLDENNPIYDQQAFDERVQEVLEGIFAEVNEASKKTILENLKLPRKERKSWYVLMKEGNISETAKDVLEDIETNIEMEYRRPDRTKYPNKKYDAMMQLSEQNDPKYQLFLVFTEAIEQIDHKLPNSLRLKYRLPGIIKRGAERVGADGLMSAISNKLQQNTTIMNDTDEIGTFVDDSGKRINQVPLFYRFNPKIKLDEQSFDLPTIFYKWFESAQDYLAKKSIEGNILQTQVILQQRETMENTLSLLGNKKERTSSHKTGTQSQYEGWVDQVFYGNRIQDMGSFQLPFTDKRVNIAKLIRALISFSSNRTMSANLVSGINNLLMAEVNQWEEAFAGQFISKESYIKAHKILVSNIKGMMEDAFSVVPNNQINRLAEYFGIYEGGENMLLIGLMRHSLNDYAYAATKIGDRQAQIKFLLAALMDTQAKDKDGNVIGNMLEMIKVNDEGDLIVDDRVDNFSVKEQDRFRIKLKRVLMDLHGNYDHKRSAVKAETAWYGVAGLALRRWIEPNFERRFVSSYYDNITGVRRTGFHRQSASWIFFRNPHMAATINYFLRFKKDADKYKIQAMKWDELDVEAKANIKRLTVEIGTAMLAYCLYALLGNGDGDDDDPVLSNIRYQAYRLYTDLTFFILPTSFTKILNEPFPVINVLTDISDIVVQLFNPFEEYETGKHTFDNILLNKVSRMIPGVKQIGRMGNISSEMEVFMRQR